MKAAISSRLSPFQLTGIVAALLSITMYFINELFSVIPVLLFALICIIAPFMIKTGFFLPVISRGCSGRNAIALTFDDGPDPEVTPSVLVLLSKYSIKAVFFVTGENAERYPHLIRKILEQGHSIGNHSYKHDPLLMLRKKKTLFKEINLCQNILYKYGIKPFAFRPPAGITNPRLRRVLSDLDMYCVNWSVRALDAGNRRINGLARKILKKVRPDDIILLHDIKPAGKSNSNELIEEFEQLFSGLNRSGLSIIDLSEIINKKIMEEIIE